MVGRPVHRQIMLCLPDVCQPSLAIDCSSRQPSHGLSKSFLIWMIQVSANTDELSILRSFHAGANDFVKKPFSRHEVLARYRTC